MALIICGDCQEEYSDYALACPVCSRPTDTQVINDSDDESLNLINLIARSEIKDDIGKELDHLQKKAEKKEKKNQSFKKENSEEFTFEKTTAKYIKVIMLAQEEARRLGHNFVGTEQIILGLIGERTGVAAKVLKSLGVNLKDSRIEVEKIIGRGSGFVAVEIPFTPRAKRVLEFSLEEALQLGHDYIDTEHLLLGLIREGEGVAARVLENLGIDLTKVRSQVISRLDETAEIVKKEEVKKEENESNEDGTVEEEILGKQVKSGVCEGWGKFQVFIGQENVTNLSYLGNILRFIGLSICEKNKKRILLLKFQSDFKTGINKDFATQTLLKDFTEFIDIVRVGENDFLKSEQNDNLSPNQAIRGWDIAKGAIISSIYSAIILDGFGELLSLDILDKEEIKEFISIRQSNVDLIFTGKKFPSYILELSDSYSEIVDKRKENKRKSSKKFLNGVEVLTGDCKGKSAYAIGRALQSIGKSIFNQKCERVLLMQWLKGGAGYTEDAALEALRENYPDLIDHLRSGRDAIVWRGQAQSVDYVEAERAWEIAKAAIKSGLYKTIILDELNPAVDLELLQVEDIVNTLSKKPKGVEVIITGRCKDYPDYCDLSSSHLEIFCDKDNLNIGIETKKEKRKEITKPIKDTSKNLSINSSNSGKAKILIVDDEPDVLSVLTNRLQLAGYQVCSATNGEEALEVFHRESPDLIVLDVMLPKMDGIAVCRRIRSESVVPIIFLTALEVLSERVAGLDLGADDYLSKPFSPKELEEKIVKILQ